MSDTHTLDTLGSRVIAASGAAYNEVFMTPVDDAGTMADRSDPRAFAAATVTIVANILRDAADKLDDLEGADNARFMIDHIGEAVAEVRLVAQINNFASAISSDFVDALLAEIEFEQPVGATV